MNEFYWVLIKINKWLLIDIPFNVQFKKWQNITSVKFVKYIFRIYKVLF